MALGNGSALLSRVILSNYKSIAECDVRLGPLVFLVGPNGVGKSNFLDSLNFVAKSLQTSPETAFESRGGFRNVRRRPVGRADTFSIVLEFQLSAMRSGRYEVEFRPRQKEGYSICREVCKVVSEKPKGTFFFDVRDGKIRDASMRILPPAAADRLYLVHAAGLPEFRPAFDALSRMSLYNINPAAMRQLRPSKDEDFKNAPDVLYRDGSNAASVLGRIEKRSIERKERILEYLSRIVPAVVDISIVRLPDGMDTLEFHVLDPLTQKPTKFSASNISDGTLRAVGVLIALFQVHRGGPGVPVVEIEEPEAALHPAAMSVLLDSITEAAVSKQVIVTSHSPDLLDNPNVQVDSILAVSSQAGLTKISPIGAAERSVLSERLYTVGELMRINQLGPIDEPVAS